MGCLLVLVTMVSARLAFFLLWVFDSERISRAFDGSFFIPFIGLLFLPWTALAWAVCWAPIGGVSGFGWFVVILAFLADLGSYGNSERTRRARGSYA